MLQDKVWPTTVETTR